MGSSDDKHWASKYLLDPLNEPEPSAVTGPGTHFRSTVAPSSIEDKSKRVSATISEVGNYPTPPSSASPHRTRFSTGKVETVHTGASTEIPTSSSKSSIHTSAGRRRGSSLHERLHEDESVRPLDVIRKSSLRAQRSPHLRKTHHHGVDSIDRLAGIDGAFHISGPFDVASQARNVSTRDSPIAALRSSNAETLRATPREAIIDSLRHHRPLDNIAALPPGTPDRTGRVLHYKEGENLQRGDGENVLRQWPAFHNYHPDDVKGKGEPSFTIERQLKKHEEHKRAISEGFEMTDSSRLLAPNNPFSPRMRASSGAATTGHDQSYREWESDLNRSRSAKGPISQKLGSLRKRHHGAAEN